MALVTRDAARRKLSVYIEAPAVRLMAAVGLSPHAVTLLGLVVAGAAAYLLSQGYLALGSATLAFSALFDQLDGALARATDNVTKFGGLLDSVVDRVAESLVLAGLLIFYLDRSVTLEPVLIFAALATSVMVSYVRARAGGLRIDCEVGIMTRPERVVVLVVALAVGQWWLNAVTVGLAGIAGLSAVTVVQRVWHVRRVLEAQQIDR